ncbi:MAG: DUF11 domain-containing protein, partial [Chloroflexi bacterium]
MRQQAGEPPPTPQTITKTTRIPAEAEIGIAKTVSAPTLVSGLIFEFTYTLVVTNTGGTTLDDVQVTEDLQAALITNAANPADSFSVTNVVVTPGAGFAGTQPTENANYVGTTGNDISLFNAGNSFEPGDSATIAITVQVDLTSDGILNANNTAQASGTDPNNPGTPVTDDSQNGNDVDPDGDGDPTNNNTPTPIVIPFPSIGVSKDISPLTQIAGTSQFTFNYTIVVTNTSPNFPSIDLSLSNVQVVEDLQAALITNGPDPADSFSVGTVTVAPVGAFGGSLPTANPNYDGNADTDLFDNGQPSVFNVGDSVTITIPVTIDLASDGSIQVNNTATAAGDASADIPGTPRISDDSQNGTDDDPDGNGNPGDNNEPTPLSFNAPNLTPSLAVVKRITRLIRGGVDVPITGIGNFNDQAGTANDNDLNTAFANAGNAGQPTGVFQLPSGVEIEPGDEVEYTIYFWNNGGLNLTNVQLC